MGVSRLTLVVMLAVACSARQAVPLDHPVGITTSRAESMPVAPMPPSSNEGSHEGSSVDGGRADSDTTACAGERGALLGSIRFDTGSAEVTPYENAKLRKIAECLTRGPRDGASVMVIGHTSAVGGTTANAALGLERAAKVRDFLVAHGVPTSRVIAVSSGERATESSDPGRRVDVVLGPDRPAAP